MTHLSYDQLERRIVTWARSQADVRAAVVVGSQARHHHPADEWSDLDLILFVTAPAVYVSNKAWLEEIGEVWVPLLNYTPGSDPEWLVLFAGGLKADFLLVHAPDDWAQWLADSPYHDVFQRGVRLLFNKDAVRSELGSPPQTAVSATHPSPEEFLAVVNYVLLFASRTARMLRRGERWRAKKQCDCDLKQRLLTMMEWHARALNGASHDTWYDGRFLPEWADPRALAALPDTFAAYEIADLWRALFATLALFGWLAQETADRLGYSYPATAHARVTAWIESLYLTRK